MKRWIVLVALLQGMAIVCGCSSGGAGPVAPNESKPQTAYEPGPSIQSGNLSETQNPGSMHLWGYYDVYVDVSTRTASAVLNRSVMFEANVVTILNTRPGSLTFQIFKTPTTTLHVDVDLDIGLAHPFPGMTQYNGYDVRGVFIGNASAVLNHNGSLRYAVQDVDQYMLDDPQDGDGGGPDGYTRWFNPSEFLTPGLLGYTKGNAASKGYIASATINPYKLFADGLSSHADACVFVRSKGGLGNDVFSAGSINYRNYYIRFPTPTPSVKFCYAVLASWKGTSGSDHPANAPEVVAASSSTDGSTLYYIDESHKGGNLLLSFTLAGYCAQPQELYIESGLFDTVKHFKPQMLAVGGGSTYSAYYVEIQSENVTHSGDVDVWLTCQYPKLDYSNEFGIGNLAEHSPLEAYFRINAHVVSIEQPWIRVVKPNGGEQWTPGASANIAWESDLVTGNVKIEYSKDGFSSDVHLICTDEPNDGSYMLAEVPYDPTKTAKVRVRSLDQAGVYDLSDGNFEILQPTITVISPNGGEKYAPGSAVEIKWSSYALTGNVIIDYSKDNFASDIHPIAANEPNDGSYMWLSIPYDPSPTVKIRVRSVKYPNVYDTSNANFTIEQPVIHVTSPNGGEEWKSGSTHAITWTSQYVVGNVNINYSRDGFVADIIPIALNEPNDGSCTWANIPCNLSNTVRVRVSSCLFSQVQDASDSDFSIVTANPVIATGTSFRDECWDTKIDGAGNAYMVGIIGVGAVNYDVFLAKYDACGNQLWMKQWGGLDYDYGNSIAFDSSGNVYVIGAFNGIVDFDPGSGVTPKTSHGSYDIFLSKFDTSGNFIWVKSWGGSWTDGGYGLAIDSSNNIYAAGDFNLTVDFDPGSGVDNRTSNGGWDAYLMKLDPNGNYLWVRTWGGAGNDYCYGLARSSSDEVYGSGSFMGTVDFDPGSGVDNRVSNGYSDAYTSKFNTSGTRIWTLNWGGSGYDSCHRAAVDSNGKVLVAGYFQVTVDLDPTSGIYWGVSSGSSDAFFSRFTSSGSFDMARSWGGTGLDLAYGIACDSSNNIYVSGNFQDVVDFDPGSSVDSHTSNGSDDAFITKFASGGYHDYARTFGGPASDSAIGVATDAQGSPYATGYFQGSCDFAPTGSPCYDPSLVLTSKGNQDAFAVKYQPDGCW